jgi:hypothetical protein
MKAIPKTDGSPASVEAAGSANEIVPQDDLNDWSNPILAYINQKREERVKEKRVCLDCNAEKSGYDFYPDDKVCKKCRAQRQKSHRHLTGACLPYDKAKGSSLYLGVHVAENVLSNVFKNVSRQPAGNPGYDFVCGKGYKVDVKSACVSHKNSSPGWGFSINKNTTADYFLCLAFDNRESLGPQFLWLIPGSVVNHMKSLVIRECRLTKWSKYQLPIDDVKKQCLAFTRSEVLS